MHAVVARHGDAPRDGDDGHTIDTAIARERRRRWLLATARSWATTCFIIVTRQPLASAGAAVPTVSSASVVGPVRLHLFADSGVSAADGGTSAMRQPSFAA